MENLSSRVSWQDLKDTLRRGGDVTFAEAHTVSFTYKLLPQFGLMRLPEHCFEHVFKMYSTGTGMLLSYNCDQ